MSISVELPADLEQEVNCIPDLDERLIVFLRDQVEYYKWRKGRYSERAIALVAEAMEQGEHAKPAGVSRAELFNDLFTVLDQVAPSS